MERLYYGEKQNYTEKQRQLLEKFEHIIQLRAITYLNDTQCEQFENEHQAITNDCIDNGLLKEICEMRDNLAILIEYGLVK